MVKAERETNSHKKICEVNEMKRTTLNRLGFLAIAMIITSCGGPDEESKIRDAVEGVVTKDFKIYEGTKRSLEDIQKTSQKRREKELDMLK